MTNTVLSLILTSGYMDAIKAVENGPKDNRYNMTSAGWKEAMKWRKKHGQQVWPYSSHVHEPTCRKAAQSLCKRNWDWLAGKYVVAPRSESMFNISVRFWRATLYCLYWKGCSRYHAWHSVPDRVWERAMNVAQLAEKYEQEGKKR